MSKRKGPPTKLRGPSRPVDPRYAPGRPARRGPDRFGMGLIAVSMAIALAVIFFAATQRGTTTTTATPPLDPVAAITATSIAFVRDTANLPHITPEEAKSLYSANNAKFIDVRPAADFTQKHIKGAVNIPHTEAQKRLSEFPKEGNVILYCQ